MFVKHLFRFSPRLKIIVYLALFCKLCYCDEQKSHIFDKDNLEPPADIDSVRDVLTFSPDTDTEDWLGSVKQDNVVKNQESEIHYQERSINLNKNNLFLLPFKSLNIRPKRQTKSQTGWRLQTYEDEQPQPSYYQPEDPNKPTSYNQNGYPYPSVHSQSSPVTKSNIPQSYYERVNQPRAGSSTRNRYPQESYPSYPNKNTEHSQVHPDPSQIYSSTGRPQAVSKSSLPAYYFDRTKYPRQRNKSHNAPQYPRPPYQTQNPRPDENFNIPSSNVNNPQNPYSRVSNPSQNNSFNKIYPNSFSNAQPREKNRTPSFFVSSTPSQFYQGPPSENPALPSNRNKPRFYQGPQNTIQVPISRNSNKSPPQYFQSSTPSVNYPRPSIKYPTGPNSRQYQGNTNYRPTVNPQNNYPQRGDGHVNDRIRQGTFSAPDFSRYEPAATFQYPDQNAEQYPTNQNGHQY